MNKAQVYKFAQEDHDDVEVLKKLNLASGNQQRKRHKIKPRFYIFILICLFFVVVLPYLRVRSIQSSQVKEITKLRKEIETVKLQIKAKKAKLDFMASNKYIEEEARKLGMTKKGEIRYLLAEPFSQNEVLENRRRNPNDLKDNNY